MTDQLKCLRCGGNPFEPDHAARCGVVEIEDIGRHRATSALAFFNAVSTGTVKTLQQHSYAALVTHGPSNMMQVHRHLQRQGLVGASHSISPRFAELHDQGFIREVGRRPCPFTGQNDIVWEAVPLTDWDPSRVVERKRCPTCGQVIGRRVKSRKAS